MDQTSLVHTIAVTAGSSPLEAADFDAAFDPAEGETATTSPVVVGLFGT